MSETVATATDRPIRPRRPPAAAEPPGAEGGRRRRGLSLGARIVVVTSLLIALAVGAAVVATVWVADGIARRAAGEALAASASLQESFRARRDEQLYLISSLFAADPFIAAYLAESATSADTASILDLLAERQAELGFDLAMVLDPQGRVVARTDRPADTGADLSARPLVARAVAELGASGIWWEGGELYQAAVVPLARGGQLVAYLLTGLALDDGAALEVKRMTSTEVVYLAPGAGGAAVVAATLDPSMEGMFLAGLAAPGGPMAGEGTSGRDLDVEIDGEPWIARLTPLAAGPPSAVASAVSLAPLAPRLAPFRRIAQVLALSGVGALLVGVVLTFAFARRTMAPVRELVRATGAARAGDYEERPVAARDDEIGQLAAAFGDLLGELREKREMEDYLASITRSLPDAPPAGAAATVQAALPVPARVEAVVMLVEWRRLARTGARAGDDAAAALGRYAADLHHLADAASRRGGSLDGVAGHRAWLRFEGDDRAARAFLTAATLMRAWADSGGGEAEAPVVALAAGGTVRGAVDEGGRPRPATLGRPVQEVESLAREAVPGELVLSDAVADELGGLFDGSGVRPRRQPGILGRRPLWVVEAADAAALVLAAPTLASAPVAAPERPRRERAFGGIAPGSVVGGRFEVLSVLGAGGMGTVFKAHDRELDEVVALKMLKPELAGDAANVERMREELRLARRITHPNVLRTFDLGLVDLGQGEVPYITMEYVQGVTLARLLDHAGRLSLSAGLRVARQLCHGLEAAHAEGVIHRDIKPPNLLLQPNGNVKLMDFGIARRQRRSDPGLTSAGWVMGTPLYLAPEQLRGEEPDARTDLYACGVVFYEMFTGAPPFAGSSYADIAAKTMREEPPPPSAAWPEIPPPLEAAIRRCLAKDRPGRPADVSELLSELAAVRA
jgi:eukaryotic-like serine/threonine-protein kinase